MKITQSGDVTIIIAADDQTKAAIDGAKERLGGLEAKNTSVLDKMKAKWLEVTAAVMAMHQAYQMMEHAAALEDQMRRLEAFAKAHKTSADAIIADLERQTRGQMSHADSISVATEALMKGMNPQQLSQFAQYGDALADSMGVKIPEAIKAMVDASMSGRGAWKLGALEAKDLDAALGSQVNTMNDLQKAQARTNIMLDVMRQKFAGANGEAQSMSDKIEVFRATISNWYHSAGVLMVKAVAGLTALFAGFGAAVNWAMGQAYTGLAKLFAMLGEIPRLGAPFKAMAPVYKELGENSLAAAESGKVLAGQAWDAAKAFGQLDNVTAASLPNMNKNLKAAEDSQKKHNELLLKWWEGIKKEAEEYDKMIKKMIEAKNTYDDSVQKHEDELRRLNLEAERKLGDEKLKLYDEQNKAALDNWQFYENLKKDQMKNSWDLMMGNANLIGGEAGQGVGMMTGAMKDINQNPYEAKLEQLRAYMEERRNLQIEGVISELQLQSDLNQAQIQMEYATAQSRVSIYVSSLQMVQGALMAYSATQKKESEAMFWVMKALSIAMIWLNGLQAAMGAAAAVAGIPVVGPALAAAAYAKWMAMTMVQVGIAAAVALAQGATRSAGSGGGSSGISAGGYSYSSPQTASWQSKQTEPTEERKTITINIHGNVVDHAAFAREIAPYIDEAKGDKVSYGD